MDWFFKKKKEEKTVPTIQKSGKQGKFNMSNMELHQACHNYDVNKIKNYLRQNDISKLSVYTSVIMEKAIKINDLDMVKLLVNKGIKDGYAKYVFKSAKENRFEISDYLVMNGFSKECEKWHKGKYHICYAYEYMKYPHLDPANDKLSQEQIDILSLFKCIEDQNVSGVKYLYEDKCVNVNCVNFYNQSPLIVACNVGNYEIIDFLISKGSYLETKDGYGSNALLEACENGDVKIVDHLVSKGASLDVKNYNGDTPLIVASMNGNLEVVKYLIKKGVDKKVKNNNGKTALNKASVFSNGEIAYLLIDD